MHTTRRTLLRTAALALPAAALVGCKTTPSAVVTFTQTALSDAANVIAGLNATLGNLVPANVVATVQSYITQAETVLGGLATQVGSLVPITSVQSVLTDLEQAAAAVAIYLPGNPYLLAVQALLPILAAAWGAVAPASAVAGGMTVQQARATLSGLPRPAMLRGA